MKNLLNISDLSYKDILKILNTKKDKLVLKNKSIGLIFEKYSTRTRLSFTVGIHDLGGNPIDIRFEELNFSRSESFEDTFLALNCYLDGLIYRTNTHSKLINASKFFTKPIINALSEVSHPCQIISDLYTLNEKFKTLNLNILWMGDMNNVCYSLIEAANLIPELNLTICSPLEITKRNKWKLNKNIEVVSKLSEVNLAAIKCVMTDVFISMNDQNNRDKIKLLKKYIVTDDLIKKTHIDSVFMHCLPAKIGSEVEEKVFRGSKSIVWKQAYNRMIAQKKLLQFIEW